MSHRIVSTPHAPAPVGPYSQAVAVGDTLYCAGQIGLDPATGKLVAGGTLAELQRVIENLSAVLSAEGLGLGDVVRTTLFVIDLADGPRINEEYAKAFPRPYPARATVQVAGLPAGARIEMDAIAVRAPR